MKKNTYFTSLAFLLLIIVACKEKNPKPDLPPATQTGENVFGCYVNGKPVKTELYTNFLTDEGVEFIDQTLNYNQLIITAITSKPKHKFRFSVQIENQKILGEHQVNVQTSPYGCDVSIYPNSGGTSDDYYTNSTLPAKLKITKYTGNAAVGNVHGNILSGTFDMKMLNDEGDTLHLKEGRFDIMYQ